jgi:hypothetical protein
MKEIHKQRLSLFANRLTILSDNQLNVDRPIIHNSWIENEIGEWFYAEYDMNTFYELPAVFKEWSFYDPANSVVVKSYPVDLDMVSSIRWFFGLNTQEFIKILGSRHYSLKDVADNIKKFIEGKTNNAKCSSK